MADWPCHGPGRPKARRHRSLYGDRVAGGLRPVAVVPCRRAGPTASSAGPRDRVGGYSARDRDDHEDRTYRSIDSRCAGRVRARGVRAVRGRVPAGPRAGLAAVRPCPLDAVLDRWWGIAAIRTNPLNEPEHELAAHAQAGGDSGWVARNEDGRWAQRQR